MILRRRALVAAVVVCACSAGAAACGVPRDGEPRRIPLDDVPAGLDPTDEVASKPPMQVETAAIWFVRDDALVRRPHRIVAGGGPSAALDELLAGPTDVERNLSLRSAIPDPSAVREVTASRGVASVELAPTFADIPANDQVLAVAQIVLTLTDLRGIGRVRFTVDGDDVAVPLPGGVSAEAPVSRDDFDVLVLDGI